MFGEICDGLALGAGHRTTVTMLLHNPQTLTLPPIPTPTPDPNPNPNPNPNSNPIAHPNPIPNPIPNPNPNPTPNPNPHQVTMLPTNMHLNATFMRSTGNWARPDYPTEGGQV